MTTYQPYSDFTAQSRTVSALMSLYGQLMRGGSSRIELTPIVVFLAFSIESYVNSIGARKINIWEELERLPWRKKIIILHKTVGRAPEWGQDPLQFANEVFALRDRLAHGKPERIVGPKFRTEAEAAQYLGGPELNRDLQPEWYNGITEDWVMKAKGRFRLLMIYLGGLFGLHESDHSLSSTGGWLIDDEKDAQLRSAPDQGLALLASRPVTATVPPPQPLARADDLPLPARVGLDGSLHCGFGPGNHIRVAQETTPRMFTA